MTDKEFKGYGNLELTDIYNRKKSSKLMDFKSLRSIKERIESGETVELNFEISSESILKKLKSFYKI